MTATDPTAPNPTAKEAPVDPAAALAAGPRAHRSPATVTPPDQPLGGWAAFRALRRNILEFFPRQAYEEPVVRDRRGRWRMLLEPADIEHVLKTNARNYPRDPIGRRILKPNDSDTLFTVSWEDWRWQRRGIAPFFQHRNLLAYGPAMTASAEATARRLADRNGEIVEIGQEMGIAAFDVMRDAMLPGTESLERAMVLEGVSQFIRNVARVSILDMIGAPAWIPRPGALFNRSARRMDRLIDSIVAERMAAGPRAEPDILDFLIAAAGAGEPGHAPRMGAAEIRNNLLGFVVAGHETTALALTWSLYLLALEPGAQEKLREEAYTIIGDRVAGAGDVEHLPFTRAVIDEALRLYPPAASIGRMAVEADEIGGSPVRPREVISIPIYALHRHRRLWEEPNEFLPDRFMPDRFMPDAPLRHRFAYLPFGGGPKICVGMGFALMEAVIILASFVARFRFTPVPETNPKPHLRFTLRPEGGVPLRIHRI